MTAVPALVLVGAIGAQTTAGPQQRLDSGRGDAPCNETSMAASEADPLRIVGAWNDFRDVFLRIGVGLSLDGGETWRDFLLRPPLQHQSTTEGDPMTAQDPRTGTLWAGGLSFATHGGMFAARLDPGATQFNPPVMISTGMFDKGWMAAGPDPFDVENKTRVYVAYNVGLQFSADMGDTWSSVHPFATGVAFLPKVGPNGELYVAYWDFNDGHWLRRSFDGGVTFGPPIRIAQRMDVWGIDGSRVPGEYRVPSLQGFAIDPNDGTLYCVYPDTTDITNNNYNLDVYFTKSTDLGTTWSVPAILNGDANPTGDQFFPWIECDDSGRLHVVYDDTRHNPQNDNAPQALIDVTYAHSDDGGSTWTEIRLTPTSWTSADDGFGGVFIGDYLGISSAGRRTFPAYMDTFPDGNADIFTNVVSDGPAFEYCFGILCPCGNDDPDAGCGSAGFDGDLRTGAVLTASGTNGIGADDLVLTASGLDANQFGLVYTGMNRVQVPFGDGRRCVDNPFFRYAVDQANSAGVMTLGPGDVVSYSVASFGAAGQLVAGDTWHYQAWYRDPGGPCSSTFNFTNAVSVTWQP